MAQVKSQQDALTPHKPGSVREAWSLTFPMMLTAASGGLMFFIDRLILAQYSTKAMTAVASAGTVVATFQFTLVALAVISQVFVGQFNGAKDYKRVGPAVWQMIWLSLSASVIFVPLALFTGGFFTADPYDDLGEPYFRWVMLFGYMTAVQSALAGFFVGLGRPKIVTWVTIVGNLTNLVLDLILVFGIEGWIPSLGARGAALATNIAFFVQVGILLTVFLNSSHRSSYNTLDCRLDWPLLKKCVKIGYPSAISHFVEIGAWAVMLNMTAKASQIHITVMAIGQSALLLFMFVEEGLNKGMSTLASNNMGAGRYDRIPQNFSAMLRIHLTLMGLISIFFLFFPSLIIDGFIEGDFSPEILTQLEYYSRWALIWVWVFMLVDGVTWAIMGLLTAAGDTKFTMYVNGTNAWVAAILPLYIWIVLYDGSPAAAWFTVACYGVVNFACFFWRYKSEAWKINKIRG